MYRGQNNKIIFLKDSKYAAPKRVQRSLTPERQVNRDILSLKTSERKKPNVSQNKRSRQQSRVEMVDDDKININTAKKFRS